MFYTTPKFFKNKEYFQPKYIFSLSAEKKGVKLDQTLEGIFLTPEISEKVNPNMQLVIKKPRFSVLITVKELEYSYSL